MKSEPSHCSSWRTKDDNSHLLLLAVAESLCTTLPPSDLTGCHRASTFLTMSFLSDRCDASPSSEEKGTRQIAIQSLWARRESKDHGIDTQGEKDTFIFGVKGGLPTQEGAEKRIQSAGERVAPHLSPRNFSLHLPTAARCALQGPF